MKKLIALSLMVVCLGCFSLGCKPAADTKKPATPATETPATPATDAPATPAAETPAS